MTEPAEGGIHFEKDGIFMFARGHVQHKFVVRRRHGALSPEDSRIATRHKSRPCRAICMYRGTKRGLNKDVVHVLC